MEAVAERPKAKGQPAAPAPAVVPRTYSKEKVLSMCGDVCWRTLQRWMAHKKIAFPKYRKLGGSTIVWVADEVDAWLIKRLT